MQYMKNESTQESRYNRNNKKDKLVEKWYENSEVRTRTGNVEKQMDLKEKRI